jgi:hypothetical protein
MKKANMLLLAGLLLGLLCAGRLAAQPSRTNIQLGLKPAGDGVPPSHFWLNTRLAAPSNHFGMTNRSLALDPAGWPHIAYANQRLHYTWHDGAEWHREIIDENARGDPSLALSSGGVPHIAYFSDADGILTLTYATLNDQQWLLTPLEEAFNYHFAMIALDSAGYPHILYYNDSLNSLRYLHLTGQGWSSETISEEDIFDAPALALDQSGRPHIAYTTDADFLYYTTWDGNQWQRETVQPLYYAPSARPVVSIALDNQGRPAIAYEDRHGLRFTARTANGWTFEAINNDAFAKWLSLAFDADNVPHLSFYDSFQDGQMYATRPAEAWLITPVDTRRDSGRYNSIAIDQQGQPHISYAHYPYEQEYWAPEDLQYAHLVGDQWVVETAEVGAAHVSPAIVVDSQEHIHLLYHDLGQNRWHYQYQTGSGWAAETISITTIPNFAPLSFTLDDGDQPHLAYIDGDGNLRYAFRTGNQWFSQLVAELEYPPFYRDSISLALDSNQNPHIAFLTDSVQYAYYSDSQWYVETIANIGGVSISLQLDTLNRSHVAFVDSNLTGNNLAYAYRSAAQWLVQPLQESALSTSLALDTSGHPHIAYQSNVLGYIYWTGEQWYYQVFDGSNSGRNTPLSIALDKNDDPHVVYLKGGFVKHAYYNGEDWRIAYGSPGDCSYLSMALNSQGQPYILLEREFRYEMWLARFATNFTYSPLISKP